jgi:hypothetical protein
MIIEIDHFSGSYFGGVSVPGEFPVLLLSHFFLSIQYPVTLPLLPRVVDEPCP